MSTDPIQLTEPQFEALKASLNNAIHELVFACQHLEQSCGSPNPADDLDEAATCLCTAQQTIETVAEQITGLAPLNPALN